MSVHACVSGDVFAIYDHNILPRLKMIIIKIVILYFIQIRHTGDLPSTGTRLVIIMRIIILFLETIHLHISIHLCTAFIVENFILYL